MKIVKQFESNEYAISMNERWLKGREDQRGDFEPFLEWGLSFSGELCCRGEFGYCNYPNWSEYDNCVFSISLKEMKKIVKEFGHLLPFL